jgi:predicted enzyme related to lactoylglutathione lyase
MRHIVVASPPNVRLETSADWPRRWLQQRQAEERRQRIILGGEQRSLVNQSIAGDRRAAAAPTEQKGHPMLGEHPIHPVLLATDLAAARAFYHTQLGLEILSDSEDAIVFRCGGGTQLAVTKSTTGTADSQTQASWQVKDVRAEVAELRSRGVKVEEYDLPGLKTQDGIADIGFAWASWIIDPGKNALGILQTKE